LRDAAQKILLTRAEIIKSLLAASNAYWVLTRFIFAMMRGLGLLACFIIFFLFFIGWLDSMFLFFGALHRRP
jgi:hypothetical protein